MHSSGSRWVWLVAASLLGTGCAGEPPASEASLSAFGVHAQEVLRDDVQVKSGPEGVFILQRVEAQAAEDTRPAETLVAAESIRLQFRNGVALDVREVGLQGERHAVHGALSSPREGGTSYWTLADDHGFEEWLELASGVAFADRAVAQWEVDGALRAVPETGGVHVLDAAGKPSVYVSAPVAWLESGERVPATLRIENGRIALYVDARGEHVLVDPLWTPTNVMPETARLLEGSNLAVPLPNGDVLVPWLGGLRYGASTAVWSSTGPMVQRVRVQHVALSLSDNRVLVIGGRDMRVGEAELFDPVANTWSAAASMARPRNLHSATLLANGRVLVVGGSTSYPSGRLDTAEIYDPTLNTWTAVASIPGGPRIWHSATRLNDGRVLVAGGSNGMSAMNSAYVYNPVTNIWTSAGTMRSVRCRHTASLLPSGRVLITGGNIGMAPTVTAEIYDPATNAFTSTGSLTHARDYHTATTMPDASVLVVGGGGVSGGFTVTERYEEARGTWVLSSPLTIGRYDHVAAPLPAGRVLVAGGSPFAASASAEVLLEDSCGNGILDPGETCDDGNRLTGDCCVACALGPLGSVCRPAVGMCDIAELCDGVTPSCPANVLLPAMTVCRASVSECDVEELCSGVSGVCAADAAQPAGTVCGPSPTGPCDIADTCTNSVGEFAACRTRFAASGTPCRPASSPCDLAETCAAGGVCPADRSAADGTSCSDGVACNGTESCLVGLCLSGTAPRCEDADICTAEMCVEPMGCTSVRIAGCCFESSVCPNLDGNPCTEPTCSASNRCEEVLRDCSDSDACTADFCTPGGGCSHTDILGCRPVDAGVDAASIDAGPTTDAPVAFDAHVGGDTGFASDAFDAARSDASTDAPSPPSCGCRAQARSRLSFASMLWILSAVTLVVRRRRASSPAPR